VRTENPDVVEQFVRAINADGAQYAYLLGPRLGRTVSKEQYLYIYDQSRVEVDGRVRYTVEDPDGLLHRTPLVVRFRAITNSGRPGFSFSLANIHTDPDEVKLEMDVLDDVFRAVQNDGSGEDDVILLGDFNADARHFGQLGQLPYLTLAIDGQATNTRRTESYDNIVFDSRATTEFTGTVGILDMAAEYRLTPTQALAVSDHLPIWAEFSVEEGASALAERTGGSAR
jgi:deoxyribonuclease-1-like protein